MMTFTIITPTVVRETLLRTCRSVDEQRYANWQHVVMVCHDLHYEGYRTQLQNTLDAMGFILTPIPETMDRFGRFMGVAERTPVASA